MAEELSSRAAVGPQQTNHLLAFRLWPRWWWVHALLFLATFVTTTIYGSAVTATFNAGQPLSTDSVWAAYQLALGGEIHIWQGMLFSVPLLAILTAHEFGHYWACRYWGVTATLPFFLPSPLLLGTFGAFIRIKSPIYKRRALFDIGVSGPMAGFLVLLPVLALGIARSSVIPHSAWAGTDLHFGRPLLIWFAEWVRFSGSDTSDVLFHPFVHAAWSGLLATAINLLPVGQLDGGHIRYALSGTSQNTLSKVFLVILVSMGYFSYSWIFWALILFILGTRHPLVYDDRPLDRPRKAVAALALVLFVLSLSLTPVRIQ